MDKRDARYWDQWWKDNHSKGDSGMFPMLPSPLFRHQGRGYDLVNKDHLLVAIMAEYGLESILCAGNGASQEPRALAAAGFKVTALDISMIAMQLAKTLPKESSHLRYFCDPEPNRPEGRVDFVVGDLLDPLVCPGPYDVIIERRTIQRFGELQRPAALEALAGRLSPVGIFLSLCLDDPFPMELGWSFHDTGLFHASETWFRQYDWTIWDGAPSSALAGQVAWLIRSGTMKPRPGDTQV